MRLVQTIGNMHISIPFEFNVPILRINYKFVMNFTIVDKVLSQTFN